MTEREEPAKQTVGPIVLLGGPGRKKREGWESGKARTPRESGEHQCIPIVIIDFAVAMKEREEKSAMKRRRKGKEENDIEEQAGWSRSSD